MDGLTLRYRTLEIRFILDELRFGHIRGKILLKCLANIEKIPSARREVNAVIYIQSDDLNNERLINSRSSGNYFSHCAAFTCSFSISFVTSRKLLSGFHSCIVIYFCCWWKKFLCFFFCSQIANWETFPGIPRHTFNFPNYNYKLCASYPAPKQCTIEKHSILHTICMFGALPVENTAGANFFLNANSN